MFDTAMDKMGLSEADKPLIVMVGNNLKKDIAGANRYGITSIWLDWSPRYFHTVEEADWQPDYTVKTPQELYKLIHRLEEELDPHIPSQNAIRYSLLIIILLSAPVKLPLPRFALSLY